MIALDTNVLVRFLVEDDAVQSRAATAVITRAGRADEPLFVSDIVLCEVVWVLSASYGAAKSEIVAAIRKLLHARQLAFQASDVLVRALEAYAAGRGDFADYLVREDARAAGCDAVLTFDKALLKESGFRRP
ncbi:MAG: PIN domain-containing protein [Gemmatimonadales bacterium]